MSEINCFGDEEVYGEVIPHWYLVRLRHLIATPHKMMVGPFEMGEGSWGLTWVNDPDFVFDLDPRSEISGEVDDPSYDLALNHYQKRLSCADAEMGYRLVNACIQAGYDMQEGGLAVWLMHRMKRHLDDCNWVPQRVWFHPSREQENV